MNRRRTASRLCALAAILVVACGESRPAPTHAEVSGVSLLGLPPVRLTLPSDNRGGTPPAGKIALGPWRSLDVATGNVWQADLPIRPRVYMPGIPPVGVLVVDRSGRALPHVSQSQGGPISWNLDGSRVTFVRLGGGEPPSLYIQDPEAVRREARLNLRWAGTTDPESFVRSTVEVGPDTFSGLLLPAPAEIALSVTVPPSGELWWRPVLVPPEVRDLAGSDGVTVEIAVEEGASSTVVATVVVPSEGAGDLLHHDLSRWTGKTVQVVFRTYPGATNVQDYLLVAEPAVAPRKAAPKRVILAFVDTLRADHTSLYGHSRDTTPWLASQAQHARVYTQARSVAPWTLPAWRSAISGRLPRFWAEGPNLAESLRDHGWATAFFAGNLYLSPRFAGNRGFGQHHLRHAPPATEQAQRAAAWLKSVPDRDVFLVVHFMDPHLPYREPEEYRHRYAGSTPRGWRDKFSRGDVLSRRTSEAERAWVRDRYDNNIRFVDDALATLDQHLRPDDLVVVFSDHGEEFWDHGGFEHGHATWDEVIRVPLVIRGPGFSAGFTPTPVSLLDLAPTVLAWAKLPPNPTHGRSLLGPLATDDRVLPFGHALYGYERWGFVQGGNKYSSTQGWEGLYQIQDDPLEQRDLWRARIPDDVGVWRAKLARAHEAMVREGWRFGLATTAQGTSGGTLEVLVPGGIAFAWAGEDAMGAGPIEVTVEGDRAQFRWASHWAGQRDLYIIPTRPIETAEALVQAANTGTPPSPMNRISVQRRRPDGDPRPLGESTLADGTRVTWTFAVAPEPKPGATEIIGYDPELELQLRAAGYIVGPTP